MRYFQDLLACVTAAMTVRAAWYACRYLLQVESSTDRSSKFAKFATATVLSFLGMLWLEFVSGGGALNGQIVGDAYYFGAQHRYVEIGRTAWWYSALQESVTLTLFALLFIASVCRFFSGKSAGRSASDQLHSGSRRSV